MRRAATSPFFPRHGVVEWCTRGFALPDRGTHRLVITRSGILRLHCGSLRSKIRSIPPPRLGEFAEVEHFVDNSSAITLGQRISLGGMRHVETRYLRVQEEIRSRRLKLTNFKGTENATDVATKHVDAATLQKCMTTLRTEPVRMKLRTR